MNHNGTHRCTEGQRLWDEWNAACRDYRELPGKDTAEMLAYSAQAYFYHKNGITTRKACPDCGGRLPLRYLTEYQGG